VTFLNRKEEVLDIQLTPYGRYLLSLGEWNPSFYAFFDDDIAYDSEYGNHPEDQNDVETRIKENTPRLHNQVVYRDVADKARSTIHYEKILLQDFYEREYSLTSVLGMADYYTNNAPSWDIDILKGRHSDPRMTYSGSGPVFNIPQVNVDNPRYVKIIGDLGPNLGPDPVFDENLREIIEFEDTYIEIREDFILLEVNEVNATPLRENFEIELFEVLDAKTEDRAGNITENLKPLRFNTMPRGTESQHVDFYLNIDVDMEIDESILCKYKGVDESKGLFLQGAFDCDVEGSRSGVDQYYTDVTDIGEVCD
jgi:hypothetical protein